jgi:hypothetical protein
MYKTIKEFTITEMLSKRYLNPNSEEYVKTHKCENCSTIYVMNPDSVKYHESKQCNHLRPGYKFFKKK